VGSRREKTRRVIVAATGKAKAGGYYGPTGFGGIRGVAGEAKRAPHAKDPALAKRRLWDVSIAMTGIDPGLPA
jgi:hypothetical protein